MTMTDVEFHALAAGALAEIDAAPDLDRLDAVRVALLGKKGRISELMKTLGAMQPEQRRQFGQQVNSLKDQVAAALDARKDGLTAAALSARLAAEGQDVTLPVGAAADGRIHPISQTIDEITAIFAQWGFTVAEGPDIEDDFHNFTALNFPEGHPARQMHDTFFLPEQADGSRKLLRTHTSPVQVRTMLGAAPPIRVICPGRTYRCDSDMTHTPMFHQVEGLVIDESTHMGHLKGCLIDFVRTYFEIDDVPVRFRPSFFPFTEPSAEVDIGCSRQGGELKLGAGGDWLEILGCGMVHPTVLKNCGIDPERYQGFAFGMGIERIAMLKYGIPDLRTFFESDLRWLRHYGFLPLDVPTLAGGLGAMKFSLSWLKSHLDTDAGAVLIGERLTALGLELESLTDASAALAGFVVGHVLSAEPHPNADRLRLCQVDNGQRVLQVVCGAPNARAGLKVVLAQPGVVIPASGEALKAGLVRGLESQGMLCSWRELGLGEDHDGIVELAPDSPVGAGLTEVIGADPLFDIAVTPNRADCLGVRGIARDLAAAGLGRLKPLPIAPLPGDFVSPVAVTLASSGCSLFAGRMIRGVANGDSPDWLKARLTSVGLKPISVLVDITNFFTLDLNRPLHVFDADRLDGDLVVRPAADGETLLALNGKTLTLTPGMTVIADASGPQSIGGVMGGEATGVSAATTTVFLEAALFAPASVAATGRQLGLDSDARYRFERGVDPAFVQDGLTLATRMILDLCGGEASQAVVAGAPPPPPPAIAFRPARVARLGGVEIVAETMQAALTGLGCAVVADGAVWLVTPPSWRIDLTAEHDLVEEVLRLNGFDAIPVVSLSRPAVPRPVLTPAQRRIGWLRRALAGRGLFETVTWSFLSQAQADRFGGTPPELRLANPISSDLDSLRPGLLPNLLAAVAKNADRGSKQVALFEIGPQFKGDRPLDQQAMAAGLRAGVDTLRHWRQPSRAVDLFDAKADLLAAITAAGGPADSLQSAGAAPAWYHPGRSGALGLGNQAVAWFGEIHPAITAAYGITLPVVAFELALDRLPPLRSRAGKARPAFRPPALQAIERDFAFVVDSAVSAETLLRAARGADKSMIAAVSLFDLYDGPTVGVGRKSLAIQVTLQPTAQTPTDAEIEAVCQRVTDAVIKATGGSLRS